MKKRNTKICTQERNQLATSKGLTVQDSAIQHTVTRFVTDGTRRMYEVTSMGWLGFLISVAFFGGKEPCTAPRKKSLAKEHQSSMVNVLTYDKKNFLQYTHKQTPYSQQLFIF